MDNTFKYEGATYPDYIRHGNAMQFIAPVAAHFCNGKGLDVGAGKWPLPGAIAIDQGYSDSEYGAMNLPEGEYDFVFSSHCLEHVTNYVMALEHWRSRLRVGGTLFLYLPHPDMDYWRPENCRKHLHLFEPQTVVGLLYRLGFINILYSGRDMAWSFTVVGEKS